jgi:hypothetical protein
MCRPYYLDANLQDPSYTVKILRTYPTLVYGESNVLGISLYPCQQ